jgi:hypothetical protein
MEGPFGGRIPHSGGRADVTFPLRFEFAARAPMS